MTFFITAPKLEYYFFFLVFNNNPARPPHNVGKELNVVAAAHGAPVREGEAGQVGAWPLATLVWSGLLLMLLHVPVEIDGPDAAAIGHQRVEAQQIVKQRRRNLVGILCEVAQQAVEVFGRMADLMVPMRLLPVGKALSEGEGIARFLRGNQVGGRIVTAARIVIVLKDGFEAVEPANLTVRQGI